MFGRDEEAQATTWCLRGASTNPLQAINTICCVILVNIPKRLEDMNILQNNYYGSLVTSCLIYDVQSPFD